MAAFAQTPQHLLPPPHLIPLLDSLLSPETPLPRVICFDLDWTLWPLFLCKTAGPPFLPLTGNEPGHALRDCAGRRVSLFPDVYGILLFIARLKLTRNVEIAIASRSEAPVWCSTVLSSLQLFPSSLLDSQSNGSHTTLSHLLKPTLTQIIPRLSKKVHLNTIKKAVRGLSYTDILFFDDQADNIKDGSKLGVTSILVDRREVVDKKDFSKKGVGLNWELFYDGLVKFGEEREKRGTSFMSNWLGTGGRQATVQPASASVQLASKGAASSTSCPKKRKAEEDTEVIDLTDD
jgi:magnesium-dependent phosphatase 1